MTEALLYVLTMVCEMKRDNCQAAVHPFECGIEYTCKWDRPNFERSMRKCDLDYTDCLKLPSQKKKEMREKCLKDNE